MLKRSSWSLLVCVIIHQDQGNLKACISWMLTLHSFPLLPRISIHRTCASGSVGFAPWTIAVPPAWINEDAHLCFRWQLSVSDWGWWWMWMGQEGRWVGGQKFLRDRKHQGRGRAYAESFWRLECSDGKDLGKCKDVMGTNRASRLFLLWIHKWWAQENDSDFSKVINFCFNDMMWRV